MFLDNRSNRYSIDNYRKNCNIQLALDVLF